MARGYASGLVTGLVVSIVAAIFAPVWRPAVSRWGRPVAKSAVKFGLEAYDTGREKLAELTEKLEDIVAETQIERAVGQLNSAPSSGTAPTPRTDSPAAS